jgi:hypothetical protein
VAEKLHAQTFLGINICLNDYSPSDVQQVTSAFQKVWRNLGSLRQAEG